MSCQRLQEGFGVVAAGVHDAVDEQGRCAANVTRRDATLDVAAYPLLDVGAAAIPVEAHDVQPELGGITLQVGVLERLLAMEEQLMHLPELCLEGGCLGSGG